MYLGLYNMPSSHPSISYQLYRYVYVLISLTYLHDYIHQLSWTLIIRRIIVQCTNVLLPATLIFYSILFCFC